MVCTACGLEQVAGAQFCGRCGARMAVAAAPFAGAPQGYGYPAASAQQYAAAMEMEKRARVRQNMQPLGIMWVMYGIYRMVMGLVGALVLHGIAYGGMFSDAPPFLPHLLGTLVPVIVTISVVMGLGGVVTGYGILSRQPWARIVGIVFGILALLKIPFGTALGIYTLWVLAPRACGMEWDVVNGEGR